MGYNKYGYIQAVESMEGRDPMTRKPVSLGKRSQILLSGYFDLIEV